MIPQLPMERFWTVSRYLPENICPSATLILNAEIKHSYKGKEEEVTVLHSCAKVDTRVKKSLKCSPIVTKNKKKNYIVKLLLCF